MARMYPTARRPLVARWFALAHAAVCRYVPWLERDDCLASAQDDAASSESLVPLAQRYLATVQWIAVAGAVLAVALSSAPPVGSVFLAVALAGSMGLAGLSPLKIGPRGKLYLDTAALVAAVLLFPPAIAVGVGAVGRFVALRFHRVSWEETRFNTAVIVIQASLAGALLSVVGWKPTRLVEGDSTPLLVALAVGALVWIVPPTLVMPMVGLQTGTSLRSSWKALFAPSARMELLLDWSQVAIGVLVAEIAVAYRWQVALLLLPAGALYQALAYHVRLRQRAEHRLKHQAFHDALTDLPNRAYFLDRLEHALGATEEGQGRVGLLFVDLDRFKFVNDSLGHVIGDELLVLVSERLRRAVPMEAVIGRFGGDEFTVLLTDVAGTDRAEQVAARIIDAFDDPFSVRGHEAAVTASIGIALCSQGTATPADLLRDADVALYRAKRNGKARYAVYDADVDLGAREKVALEVELRRAVERHEFFLVFQPQIELATGRLAAFEALVRWRHPTRGVLMPDAFVPLAEESGLILPIGRWVLEEACRAGREWRDGFAAAPVIGVNLSARQFQDDGLIDDVTAVLESSGLPPARLKLEITESAMLSRSDDAEVLSRLKALGVGIAIDDFGTGYSSLDYLRRFPVDEIKIDRAFVAGLGRDGSDTTIVRAIVGLAHALGLAVVAEGVETDAQAIRLRDLGCELGQGYFFDRPLPAVDATAVLERMATTPGLHERVVILASPQLRKARAS